LQRAELRTGGFEELVKLAGKHDQVYCDPPYLPLTQSAAFTAYCKVPFGLREQRQLAEQAVRAAERGAKVVLSNHDLPIVRDLIYPEKQGFRIVDSPAVSRAISRDVQSRKPILEVIASIGPFRLVA
jgi:DNA adenine methylase